MKNIHSRLAAAAVFAALGLSYLPAQAHVVLEYEVAYAGRPYKATFKVGHGCGVSATKQITVIIPEGVRGARPMPKAGWSLEIVRAPLAVPYDNHGKQVREDVARITWTARSPDNYLPDDQYDEFVLSAQAPDKAGTIYWPVQQVCVEGRSDWTEVPGAGKKAGDLRYPAAVLEVVPSGGGSAHMH